MHGWMNGLDWFWMSMLMVFWILVIGLLGYAAALLALRPSHSRKVQRRRPEGV